MLPIRRVANDLSFVIPWPRPEEPLAPSTVNSTSSDLVDERTHYIETVQDCPVPLAAISQIRNPYSKFRVHDRITSKDILRVQPPKMPLTESKKAFLADKRLEKKRPTVEFTKEIEDFIGQEIEKGLKLRIQQDKATFETYK